MKNPFRNSVQKATRFIKSFSTIEEDGDNIIIDNTPYNLNSPEFAPNTNQPDYLDRLIRKGKAIKKAAQDIENDWEENLGG